MNDHIILSMIIVAFGGFGAPAAAASPFGQPAQTGFGGFGQTAPQTAG
jgi:hypothetical protein